MDRTTSKLLKTLHQAHLTSKHHTPSSTVNLDKTMLLRNASFSMQLRRNAAYTDGTYGISRNSNINVNWNTRNNIYHLVNYINILFLCEDQYLKKKN